ncbi:MAG TPA: nicotinate-nucleotide diphosphorylase [Acidimicrobiales bacterium]|nr:nicotinate-nucleotide diphosphorylase [Acidimicrobiales bacterium]
MSFDPPLAAVREAVARALAEDLGPLGDLTAALLPPDVTAVADIVPRSPGALAGRLAAAEAFAAVDASVAVEWRAADGDELEAGRAVATVTGRLASIVTAERTALNFLGHLSGVATLTRRYAVLAAPARIRDTRKTTPGLRALEKAAVRAGGGVNHRGSLSDGILLKDNHLARLRDGNAAARLRGENAAARLRGGNAAARLSIAEAVARARGRWPGRSVQVECDTGAQVEEALAAGADLVLLDNMTPVEVAACVQLVGAASVAERSGRCLVEVSGGVTLETVADYAAAGADLVSVGALTHSAPVLDLGLDVRPAWPERSGREP